MSLSVGYLRTSQLISNIDRGLAYPGVYGEFENGEYADQSGSPHQRQRSGVP